MKRAVLMIIGILAAVSFGCASTASSPDGTMASGASSSWTSDADIAGIVATANEGEVMEGNAAAANASSPDVKSFAQMMVSDHTAALSSARDVFSRRNITPGDNDTTQALRSGAQQTVSALNTYTGSAFDRTYMQTQVDIHQWLLNTLDTNLIPSARNSDLRALLQTQRAAVATHLERARAIASRL